MRMLLRNNKVEDHIKEIRVIEIIEDGVGYRFIKGSSGTTADTIKWYDMSHWTKLCSLDKDIDPPSVHYLC